MSASEAMFDSSVLIRALEHKPGIRLVSDDADRIERCAKVVKDAQTLRVSPIAWFEVVRFANSREQALITALEKRVRIERLDARTVGLANSLMRARIDRWDIKVCSRCGNPAKAHPCDGCGLLLSERTRFNDYLIVAHAEVLRMDLLYTADRRMVSLGENLRVKIMVPPGVHGPLFDEREPVAAPEAKGSQ